MVSSSTSSSTASTLSRVKEDYLKCTDENSRLEFLESIFPKVRSDMNCLNWLQNESGVLIQRVFSVYSPGQRLFNIPASSSSTPPVAEVPPPLLDLQLRAARLANSILTAIPGSSSSSRKRVAPDTASPESSASPGAPSSSSGTSRSVIPRTLGSSSVISSTENAEIGFFNQLCMSLDAPSVTGENVLRILSHLRHLSGKPTTFQKEIFRKIAQVYTEEKFGLKNLDLATEHYTRASELGCETSSEKVAVIKKKQGDTKGYIEILRTLIPLPKEFFTCDGRDIHKLDVRVVADSEAVKTKKIRMIKLLALEYSKTDIAIANRLYDLAAHLGDVGAEEKICAKITEDNKSQIAEIGKLNEAFRTMTLLTPSVHSTNPARSLHAELMKKVSSDGFINMINKYFLKLTHEIISNEALSRYVCYTHKKCTEGEECSRAGEAICERILLVDRENALSAWVLASLKIASQASIAQSELDRLSEIAKKGGFSDPRVPGSSLYPNTGASSSSSSSLFDDIEVSDDFLGGL